MSPLLPPLTLFVILSACGPLSAHANPPQTSAPPDEHRALPSGFPSFSLGTMRQGETDMDGGGTFEAGRVFGSLGYVRPRPGALGNRLGLSFDVADYDFAPVTDLADGVWDRTYRLGAQVAWLGRAGTDWRYFLGPTLAFSGESDARASDAMTYGLIGAFTWISLEHRAAIGFGAAAFYGLEEFRAFPLVVARWQFADHWAIANPLRAGPTGPAGLELRYLPGPDLNIGLGSAYRSDRFRLGPRDGPADRGIAEQNGLPVWLRVGYRLHRFVHLNAYAGVILAGSLELQDADGRDLQETDYDRAPFASIVLNIGRPR